MPKRRILIVDDEEDIRSIVRASLATKYEVVEAADGLDALQKLELAEPDFVVLDVMMPLMDGFSTCAAIRRHERFKGVSVLFLSALNTKEDIMKGYGVGANLYLTKPFDPSRLLRNVDLFFESNAPPWTRKKYTIEQLKEMERLGADALATADAEVAALQPRFEEIELPPMPVSGDLVPPAIPAAPPPVPVAQTPAPMPVPPPPAPPVSRTAAKPLVPRIMVVDDDMEMQDIVRATLGNNYEVVSALDGIQAIEKITSYQPDLIVLDAVMPKMSGFQLCQSLRKNPRYAGTPILMVSGKSTPRDREYALRIGVNEFLAKPFDPAELRRHIDSLMASPAFKVYQKTLDYNHLVIMENRRKRDLEERHDRLDRHEESELERFLRDHQ